MHLHELAHRSKPGRCFANLLIRVDSSAIDRHILTVRWQRASKPNTYTELADVNAVGISVKVGAAYSDRFL